jgi:hypothetical protein
MSFLLKKIYILPGIIFSFFALSKIVLAEAPYRYILLEPSVFGDTTGYFSTTLGCYVNRAFELGIGLAVVFAVMMITYGGITYMTTDVLGTKEKARQIITDAFTGLVLALISWLILATVHIQFITFEFGNCASSYPPHTPS